MRAHQAAPEKALLVRGWSFAMNIKNKTKEREAVIPGTDYNHMPRKPLKTNQFRTPTVLS
jgi:hypothetical protein